jgi:hypothetical protein
MLCVGTSKTLTGKKLRTPKTRVADGIEPVPSPEKGNEPTIWLRENVNNQGCLADQVLDFDLRIPVRNVSKRAVELSTDNVTLRVDGKKKKLDKVSFRLPDEKGARYVSTLQPGDQGVLFVNGRSILPKKRLEEVERIELIFSTEQGKSKLTFEDVKKAPVQTVP